jgi:ribonuclease P protein component
METLRKRSEFVLVQKHGKSVKTKAVIVVCLKSQKNCIGFTASKKVGCAVLRNKAKRRLRHLVREFVSNTVFNGFSFVCVANAWTHQINFNVLRKDFLYAATKSMNLAEANGVSYTFNKTVSNRNS